MTKEAVAAKTAELAAKEEIGDLRRRFDSMMDVIDKSRESLTEFAKCVRVGVARAWAWEWGG